MSLSPGARLGPYEVVSLLGAGGMGEVYRARDTRLGREVAVKVLPASVSADTDRLRRFELEARAASLLDHPHIVAIHDVGIHDGTSYVVSELLEGDTLRARVGTALPPRKAIEYALQIARGLAAAHEKGIVHRDLKPENVFVTSDGRIKILDFGLAKLTQPALSGGPETDSPTLSRGTDPGTVMGTVGYMSPEQVRGRAADPRADIFSFGAILYEMLAGRRAFKGETAADTLTAILKEEPPEISATRSTVSPALERIVRHCLEKNPESRFQSARDVAFDLEALTETSGSGARGPAAALPRRQWLRWAVLGLVLLVGGALGIAAGRAVWHRPLPTFKQLTFRRGGVDSAFFTSDGQTVVYGALWDGGPPEIFSVRVESLESRSLGLPPAWLLSVSSQGELAIRLAAPGDAGALGTGVLARVPLSGGVPRPLLERVRAADWSPDGRGLAVVREVDGQMQLEYPVGKVLKRPVETHAQIRVSPRGDRVVLSGWKVSIFDLMGHETPVNLPSVVFGVAWSAQGEAVWANAGENLMSQGLWRVTLDGKAREVFRSVGDLALHDVSKDGRVLFHTGWGGLRVRAKPADAQNEFDVSVFDQSGLADLSADGTQILLSEEAGGRLSSATAFLRSTRGGPSVRLGEGTPYALSPDAKWAVIAPGQVEGHPRLTLTPTGPGEPRELPVGRLERLEGAAWFAGPKRLVLDATEPGRPGRSFVIDLAGGEPRAVTPEGTHAAPYSDRDDWVIGYAPDGTLARYSLAGGTSQPISVRLPPRTTPIRLGRDGRSLLICEFGPVPLHVERLDLATGQRTPWKVLQPDDPVGVGFMLPPIITPDEGSYAYTHTRFYQNLYVVEGLR